MPGKCQTFLDQALKSETDECIVWPFCCDRDGYPMITFPDTGKKVVSRLVCEATHGPAPFIGAQAAHRCHNPSCINPRHVRWLSPKANSAERDALGRRVYPRGADHPNHGEGSHSKLSEAQVLSIYRDGHPARDEAARYGVAIRTINAIRSGQNWAWLTIGGAA